MHSPLPFWTACALALFPLGAAAQAGLVLAPDLQDKVEAHARGASMARPIVRFTSVEEIDHKADIGKRRVELRAEVLVLDSGLVGVSSTSGARTDASRSVVRGVGLCGFLGLVAEAESSTEYPVVVPIGKMFLPFGLTATSQVGQKLKVTAFDASIPSVCKPPAGSEFTYSTSAEYQLRTSGVFGGTRTLQRVEAGRCRVGKPLPASALAPKLEGNYLQVDCDLVTDGKPGRQASWVYLEDSSFYLPTARVEEWQRSTVRYTEVEYAAPAR